MCGLTDEVKVHWRCKYFDFLSYFPLLQLNGVVDDCTCKVESVSEFNNIRLFPPLNSLLNKNYFKFFKVSVHHMARIKFQDGLTGDMWWLQA